MAQFPDDGKPHFSLKDKRPTVSEVCYRVFAPFLVYIGVWGGVLQDCRAFTDKETADKYEQWLCKEYGLPYDQKERQNTESDGDVYRYEILFNEPLPQSIRTRPPTALT